MSTSTAPTPATVTTAATETVAPGNQKPSELLRQAKQAGVQQTRLLTFQETHEGIRYCALGAIALMDNRDATLRSIRHYDHSPILDRAIGMFPRTEMIKQWPEGAREPSCGTNQGYAATVVFLNDECGWTFNQIADWLESEGF